MLSRRTCFYYHSLFSIVFHPPLASFRHQPPLFFRVCIPQPLHSVIACIMADSQMLLSHPLYPIKARSICYDCIVLSIVGFPLDLKLSVRCLYTFVSYYRALLPDSSSRLSYLSLVPLFLSLSACKVSWYYSPRRQQYIHAGLSAVVLIALASVYAGTDHEVHLGDAVLASWPQSHAGLV